MTLWIDSSLKSRFENLLWNHPTSIRSVRLTGALTYHGQTRTNGPTLPKRSSCNVWSLGLTLIRSLPHGHSSIRYPSGRPNLLGRRSEHRQSKLRATGPISLITFRNEYNFLRLTSARACLKYTMMYIGSFRGPIPLCKSCHSIDAAIMALSMNRRLADAGL